MAGQVALIVFALAMVAVDAYVVGMALLRPVSVVSFLFRLPDHESTIE